MVSFEQLGPDNYFFKVQENICCGYSLECLIEALLMNTHNICFHEEVRKTSIFWVEKKTDKPTPTLFIVNTT